MCAVYRTLFLVDRPGKLAGIVDVARWAAEFPGMDVREVPGTNHYTLLFNDSGTAAIVGALAAAGASPA